MELEHGMIIQETLMITSIFRISYLYTVTISTYTWLTAGDEVDTY